MKTKLIPAILLGLLGLLHSSPTTHAAATSIPFSEIGAKATPNCKGDAIGIRATADGARLYTGFQKLSGTVTRDGLRLDSRADKGGGLRLVASAMGRNGRYTPLPSIGTVVVGDKIVTFARPRLTEEYSVSVDGLRQDFIVAERPAGAGDLRVELAITGAKAEPAPDGARLVLDGSGRKLAYNRLRVSDARGKELAATLEVRSKSEIRNPRSEIILVVDDTEAVYPVRIDPTFSDANWAALGSGMNNSVSALLVSGTNLYAGGNFTTAGGAPANSIAEWNGSSWSALGSGISGSVTALAADTNGNLYAGGTFSAAGGVAATNVAKWNGSAWSGLGWSGLGAITALAVDSSGNLYVGGTFTILSGATSNANCIAKWNGTAWSTLGGGLTNGASGGFVTALVADTNGNIYVGGTFTGVTQMPANRIAKWNGTAFSTLGSGVNSNVAALALDSSGDLYVGGAFTTAGGAPANSVAKWNGTAWSALGGGMNSVVLALAVDSLGNLYAGGLFTTPNNYLAEWHGTAWSGPGSGMNNSVSALAFDSSGNLYAGGSFTTVGGKAFSHIAEAKPAPGIAVQQPAGANLANGASIAFGTLNAGSTSNLTFTIQNTGYLTLTLGAITEDGADPGDFTLNTNAMPTTLAPDATTTFTVTFSPLNTGSRTAAIHIASGDTNNNPFNLNLTGTGNPQKIAVQQPAGTNLVNGVTIGFGNVSIAGSNLTFTIQNTGGFNLALGPITTDGANPGDFPVNTNAMLTTVPPGASTTFTLAFDPVTSGPRSAAIHIANNDNTADPFNIGLNGFGYYNQAQYDANFTAGVSSGVTSVTNNPNAYSLYTSNQLQALDVRALLLAKNPTNGTFTLTIGVQKATNLVNFLPLPMTGPGTSTAIDGQGNLEFQFTAPDNAAFFRLGADQTGVAAEVTRL